MRVLVTGARGFAGRRLVARLAGRTDVELFALGRRRPAEVPAGATWIDADLTDRPAAVRAVRAVAPAQVVHLAALADPRACAREPLAALSTNAGGTAAVLAACRGSGARVLVVSSAQVYGPGDGRPLAEDAPLLPRDAYGRSKRCAERVALTLAGQGLEVLIARPFNHSGRGQSSAYVLAALAESVRAARGGGELRTGNLFPRRDFLHVDDVLDAYECLLARGAPGGIYNVCRGETRSIGELLAGLQQRLGFAGTPVLDPARARAGDPPLVVGDPARLRALGWRPRVSWEALLDDVAGATGDRARG
jgi:GDP-4-dehydro-6-deoxy-D-mannose reductase